MKDPTSHTSIGLALYARLVVCATFFLIFVGAMVTSMDAGLSVPDWPLSFGSLNPPQYLTSIAVFWEHSHRMVGAIVGLLVLGLAVALARSNHPRWVKTLGFVALAGVVVQGLLGGLRVLEKSITYAIIHGCTAQALMGVLLLLAIVTSPRWKMYSAIADGWALQNLRLSALLLVPAVYIQLILGAVMRHHKAGLSIPVFPQSTLDGGWIPSAWNFGVAIHFAHRCWAIVVLLLALSLLVTVLRRFSANQRLVRAAWLLAGLLCVQVAIGALVIWHLRPFTLTSLHVVNGASVLATSLYLAAYALATRANGPLLATEPSKDVSTGGLHA